MTPEIPVLRELLLLAGASLAVVLLFRRLRLPATVGFIVTGILIGPGGFALVRDPELVRTLAEFGVVVLLFTVGLEFSFADLRRLGRRALVGGALQVLLTVVIVAGALVLDGRHPARALFLGMLVSLSSTALVLKLLTDRIELQSPHGRAATGVLLFQDLVAVPFLLLVVPLGRWARGERFTAAELSEERLAAARRDGVEEATTEVVSLPADRFDVVIDATGAPAMLSQAIRIARPGGRILMFGVSPQGKTATIEPFQVFRKGLSIFASYTSRRNSLQALALIASGRVRVDDLVSHRLPLDGFEAGIRKIEDRGENAMKVMVFPNEMTAH